MGVFCIGDREGRGGVFSSTLCRYDIRMGLLLVLSWGEGATCFSGKGEF